MEVIWSPHARDLLADILTEITLDLSREDAHRWRQKINASVEPLLAHPMFGKNVPTKCFLEPPEDIDRLHQLICGPYRIVYEPTSVACYILSIRHYRMMLRNPDTDWNWSPHFAIPDPAKREQEAYSLRHVRDSLRKIVITGDPHETPWMDKNGITYMGLKAFLLNPKSIEGL